MERLEQKDQKVGKYESDELCVSIGRLVNFNVTSLRQGHASLCRPLHLADLPDLFVGLLVPLCAAPFNSVESGTSRIRQPVIRSGKPA